MARDRKRAKQRRERRAHAARTAQAGQASRADVPGALDHASADVDEFDAALVRGAGGVTATPETETEQADSPQPDVQEGPAAGAEDSLQLPESASGGGRDGGGSGDGAGGEGGSGGDPDRPSGAPLRGGNRAIAFLRASWAELHRVQWPDRRQVTQATAVVLGFVAIAGAYLGLADYVAKELVEFIL